MMGVGDQGTNSSAGKSNALFNDNVPVLSVSDFMSLHESHSSSHQPSGGFLQIQSQIFISRLCMGRGTSETNYGKCTNLFIQVHESRF